LLRTFSLVCVSLGPLFSKGSEVFIGCSSRSLFLSSSLFVLVVSLLFCGAGFYWGDLPGALVQNLFFRFGLG